MRLDQLPIDILALLLNDKHSWVAIELWKAGNASLNAKLRNGAITRVNLEDYTGKTERHWPKCLMDWKLESLRICRSYGLFSSDQDKKDFRLLHRGLKSLEIIGAGSVHTVFLAHLASDKYGLVSEDGRTNRPSSKLPLTAAQYGKYYNFGNVDDSDDSDDSGSSSDNSVAARPSKRPKLRECDSPPWNLNDTWPNMTRLVVGGAATRELSRISDAIFSVLPRSLEHFGLKPHCSSQSTTYMTLRNFDRLPPNLVSLHLPPLCLIRVAVPRLPPRITDIGASLTIPGHQALVEHPEYLPNLSVCSFVRCNLNLDFIVSSLSSGQQKCFPPSLTSFYFNGYGTLPSKIIHAMPPSLTEFLVEKLVWKGISYHTFWPPSLTLLEVRNAPDFGPHYYHILPPNLTTLRINTVNSVDGTTSDSEDCDSDDSDVSDDDDDDGEEDENEAMKYLELATLCTRGKSILNNRDQGMWSRWKNAAQCDGRSLGGDRERLNVYISAVEDGQLLGLPLTLKSMTIGIQAIFVENFALVVPPGVIELSVEPWQELISSQVFSLLPTSLTSLALGVRPMSVIKRSSAIHDHPIHKSDLFAGDDASTSSPFRNLTSLQHLALAIASETHLASITKLMPRNLLSLHLEITMPQFNPSDLAFLPPTLTSLKLKGSHSRHDKLGTLWLQALPRSILHLSIMLIPLHENSLSRLPPCLLSLDCTFSPSVSLWHLYNYLPHSLVRLQRLYESYPRHFSLAVAELSAVELDWICTTFSPFYRIWNLSFNELELKLRSWPKTMKLQSSSAHDSDSSD